MIAFYDNIPILSWMVLRARCRACREPISARYPAVEFLTGLAFAAVAWRDFLRAWGEVRAADVLARDDDGRYAIG